MFSVLLFVFSPLIAADDTDDTQNVLVLIPIDSDAIADVDDTHVVDTQNAARAAYYLVMKLRELSRRRCLLKVTVQNRLGTEVRFIHDRLCRQMSDESFSSVKELFSSTDIVGSVSTRTLASMILVFVSVGLAVWKLTVVISSSLNHSVAWQEGMSHEKAILSAAGGMLLCGIVLLCFTMSNDLKGMVTQRYRAQWQKPFNYDGPNPESTEAPREYIIPSKWGLVNYIVCDAAAIPESLEDFKRMIGKIVDPALSDESTSNQIFRLCRER